MSVNVAFKRISLLGEGPHWDEKSQSLLYVDISAGDICRFIPETGETESLHLGKAPSLIVPYSSDPTNFIISQDKTLLKFNWNTQKKEILWEVDADVQNTRFNDGKCDAKGRLWAGTMSLDDPPGVVKESNGSLYSFMPGSPVKKHISKISISNGIAWSLDQTRMFYIDSVPRKIYSFNFDLQTGNLGEPKVLVDFNTNPGYSEFGFPDGMTNDEEGKLWVACFNGYGVIRIDPETSQILQKIDIPAKQITSCCFGGRNYDELYVTSASVSLSDEERKANPLGGSLFKITELGVKGFAANDFSG